MGNSQNIFQSIRTLNNNYNSVGESYRILKNNSFMEKGALTEVTLFDKENDNNKTGKFLMFVKYINSTTNKLKNFEFEFEQARLNIKENNSASNNLYENLFKKIKENFEKEKEKENKNKNNEESLSENKSLNGSYNSIRTHKVNKMSKESSNFEDVFHKYSNFDFLYSKHLDWKNRDRDTDSNFNTFSAVNKLNLNYFDVKSENNKNSLGLYKAKGKAIKIISKGIPDKSTKVRGVFNTNKITKSENKKTPKPEKTNLFKNVINLNNKFLISKREKENNFKINRSKEKAKEKAKDTIDIDIDMNIYDKDNLKEKEFNINASMIKKRENIQLSFINDEEDIELKNTNVLFVNKDTTNIANLLIEKNEKNEKKEKNENLNGIKKYINPGIIKSKDNNLSVGNDLLDFNLKKKELTRKNSIRRISKPKNGNEVYNLAKSKQDFALNNNNNNNFNKNPKVNKLNNTTKGKNWSEMYKDKKLMDFINDPFLNEFNNKIV